MAHDVFISYATEDKRTADAVCARLEQQGLRCWIAPRDLRPGSLWEEAIVDAIQAARALVLVFSAHANESPDVAREVSQAVRRGLSVITFRIEDVVPSGALDYNLNSVHWLDAMTAPLERHMDRLAGTLRSIVAAPSNGDRDPTPARAPASPRAHRPMAWRGLAAVGLVLLAAGAFLLWRLTAVPAPARDVTSAGASPAAMPPDVPPPGPTTALAAVDPAALREMKAQAQSSLRLMCDDLFCRVPPLREGRAAVRALRLGEVSSRLDRRIALRAPDGSRAAARYEAQYLPYRPGAEMYVQLEFVDGTYSDVRPAEISRRSDELRPAAGVRLFPAQPGPPAASALFVSYVWPYERLQFVPEAPGDASAVWYSLDGGPYRRAAGIGTADGAFQFDGPVADALVRVRVIAADGVEAGPFEYQVRETATLVTSVARRRAGTLRAPRAQPPLACARVSLTLPPPSADSLPDALRPRARADSTRAASLLESAGLSFLARAPAVACVAAPLGGGRTGTGAGLADWSVIRAVRVQAQPGGATQQTLVQNRWHGTLAARDVPRGREFEVWHVVLPADTQSVVAQFVLDDGTETAALSAPLREIR